MTVRGHSLILFVCFVSCAHFSGPCIFGLSCICCNLLGVPDCTEIMSEVLPCEATLPISLSSVFECYLLTAWRAAQHRTAQDRNISVIEAQHAYIIAMCACTCTQHS